MEMEFTPGLTEFQGVIISADAEYSFSNIISKGGNESKVDYIVQCIRDYLQKENFIIDNNVSENCTEDIRKFTLYLILNTDFCIVDEMVDFEELDLIIWTIPVLSKYLLCELLSKLNLDKCTYEALVFSYPLLALELGDALISHFKYLKPTECLHKITLLALASYRLIIRFLFFDLGDEHLKHAMLNFQRFVNFFTDLPNLHMLDNLTTDDSYKFIGNRLSSLLMLCGECFLSFISIQEFKPPDFEDIYEITYKDGTVINDKTPMMIANCNNHSLIKCINDCNVLLLDKCKTLITDVSVEIYCAWSEFTDGHKSMQQTLGELCNNVHTILCSIASVSDHPVVSMLQQLSHQPLNVKEIINETDTDTILENIKKKDCNITQWIKALVHKDNICEESALLELIDDNLHLLDRDECYKLFQMMYKFLKTSVESNENLLLLAIKVFQSCSNTKKLEIVNEHFSNDAFNDTLQTSNFKNTLTEIFNKLIISSETDICDVLAVFIQSPCKVFSKIFNLASENIHQIDIMVTIMKSLRQYANFIYDADTESCLIVVAKEVIENNLDTNEKQNNFVKFLSLLKIENIIPGSDILLLIVMPNFHEALLNTKLVNIYIMCRLLEEAYPILELLQYRAPILAMLAQISDRVRWKIDTFAPLAPNTLAMLLKMKIILLSTYQLQLPGHEFTWLKSKLRNIHPLNMYYFRDLWNPPGNTYVEVITGIDVHIKMDKDRLISVLAQVICSTTYGEWHNIWDSLSIFDNENILDIFNDSMLSILIAERSIRTEASRKCLLNCMTNYVEVIRYKFFSTCVCEKEALTVLKKFAGLEQIIPESDADLYASICMPLFSFISVFKSNIHRNKLLYIIGKFKHTPFTTKLNLLFL